MSNSIEEHLTSIDNELALGHGEEPERRLTELIRQLGRPELKEWRVDLVRIVDKFQNRRKRRLMAILDEETADGRAAKTNEPQVPTSPEETTVRTISGNSRLVVRFRAALNLLHEQHIFQWSTYYRDYLAEFFGEFFTEMKNLQPDDLCTAFSEPLMEHSATIFAQGYDFVRMNRSYSDPVQKSLSGFSRFLDLPLDFYTASVSRVSDRRSAIALRLLISSAVAGIVKGYSSVNLGDQTGRMILPRMPRNWAHYIAFLTPYHAEDVINHLEPGPFSSGLTRSVLPLLDALQRFFEREDEDFQPLPIVGQYRWQQRRLDITVRPPHGSESQRFIEANAFLDGDSVATTELNDAVGRQVSAVIAPLRPDVREIVDTREGLGEIVIPAEEDQRELTANRTFNVLDDAFFAFRTKRRDVFPITYNFAREFPLLDPNKAKFYHVSRSSVRDLLRTFERKNGVRLWCSVRRSGKTTACFDLESSTGDSVIIGQTCGTTQHESASVFYNRVADAVDSGKRVSRNFISDLVIECAPLDVRERRMVLVIDEYETLFGLFRSSVEGAPNIRYTVVQPILDQLMAFSYNNLLVFLGQQPNAHFILMEQNQLAPYVEQDSFPLFEHRAETTSGEFAELVRKIFTDRIDCAPSFVDSVFEETAGHPFLTANVLGEFVDWLIEKRRPLMGLRVDKRDFSGFMKAKLDRRNIELSRDYEFFRQAASQAMSQHGYRTNPWLYAAYWLLRLIGQEAPNRFRVSVNDFEGLVEHIPTPDGAKRFTSAELVRSASQANFLSYDKRWVNVRIRTLGRIAVSVRPALA
ncbi:MAG: hypothetical protein OXC01_06665 [Immundisolibacterales bacterium]|nr:hypothetical protein [Immundisolibacterales bacterium]